MNTSNFLHRTGWLGYRLIYNLVNVFSRARIMQTLNSEITRLEKMPHSPRILSIGSSGIIGDRINRIQGAEIISVDIDPARNPDVVADITSMPAIKNEDYDYVFLMEVLEHVKEPANALAEIRRVMKQDATLLLSSPFIFEAHDLPHDYYRYTRQGLQYLLQNFSNVEINARNGYLHSACVLPMRLIVSPYITDKLLAIFFVSLTIALYPAIYLLDKCIQADTATSGYIAKCRK